MDKFNSLLECSLTRRKLSLSCFPGPGIRVLYNFHFALLYSVHRGLCLDSVLIGIFKVCPLRNSNFDLHLKYIITLIAEPLASGRVAVTCIQEPLSTFLYSFFHPTLRQTSVSPCQDYKTT